MLKDNYDELLSLKESLQPIDNFINKHNKLTLIEFDYYSVHDLTLFVMNLSLDFIEIEQTIKQIEKALPALKRVVAKPIIELKDVSDVVPVELARTINQDTINHLSTHMSNIQNITNNRIKPAKLLTRAYEDNYSIYENIATCNLIDEVLSYIRKIKKSLQELIYTNEVMQVNLFERVNHLNYFLALGKLQTSYIRDFDKYYLKANEDIIIFNRLYSVIKARLNSKLYRRIKIHNKRMPLKKTNIFLMQKDYHRIYILAKYFHNRKSKDNLVEEIDFNKLDKSYVNYLKILIIFSLFHLDFVTNKEDIIDFNNLNVSLKFKEWTIKIYEEASNIILQANKNVTYKILLCPIISVNQTCHDINIYNEILYITPIEEYYTKSNSIYLSIENIDSFRRMQQIILKAMIESDTIYEDCPYCSHKLIPNENHDYFYCPNCKMEIYEGKCDTTNNFYHYTSIKGFTPNLKGLSNAKTNEWLYNRKIESLMYFRNITKIDENGSLICPLCGNVHKNTNKNN